MDLEKRIDVLNTLVEINNDRVEGYETATKETEEQDLKRLFGELANTSKHNNRELSDEIIKIGGEPTDSTRVSGKFYRAWMDVKAALTGKDRKAILNSCEYGEDQALETYDDVLKDDLEHLSQGQQSLIREQHASIKADYIKVKSMSEALA